MNDFRCPGQDKRHWKPEDIFNLCCPHCAAKIEFFKDDPVRLCPSCRQEVRNPKIDLGCAKWCKFADQCLGSEPRRPEALLPEDLIQQNKH